MYNTWDKTNSLILVLVFPCTVENNDILITELYLLLLFFKIYSQYDLLVRVHFDSLFFNLKCNVQK